MADTEVLRRNNMSQKRKTRNAIEVINRMVEGGEVDKLWRDFHMSLKSAREKTVCCSYFDTQVVTQGDNGLFANLSHFSLSWVERGCSQRASVTSGLGISFEYSPSFE